MKAGFIKYFRKAVWLLVFLFALMNVIAFAHAYKFTHFSSDTTPRTKDPKELTWLNKVNILFTGIDNPRPRHKTLPEGDFETLTIGTTDKLRCWLLKVNNAKGTVILFHGYAGEKSSLLGRAEHFNTLGYNTLLVDFLGAGDSDGASTSVGYHEAAQVLACYEFLENTGERNIVLFGTSMGAAAILKAIRDQPISPAAIVLECPFGSLYDTVCARFKMMSLPTFPMAGLLTFWGGVQHGYWAFEHNPATYAHAVKCPTLLLYGEQDDRVTLTETHAIYNNLKAVKTLKTYSGEGHNFYNPTNEAAWKNDVTTFINQIENI